jgi:hypothetical protein
MLSASNASCLETTTSTPSFPVEMMSLNARSIWPVSVNVPEIIATPSTIAIEVRIVRSLRVKSPRRMSFVMSRPYSSELTMS